MKSILQNLSYKFIVKLYQVFVKEKFLVFLL